MRFSNFFVYVACVDFGWLDVTVYMTYLAAGRGTIMIPLILLFIMTMQGSQVMNSYTLVWWEAKYVHFPPSISMTISSAQHMESTHFILPNYLRMPRNWTGDIHVFSVLLLVSSEDGISS